MATVSPFHCSSVPVFHETITLVRHSSLDQSSERQRKLINEASGVDPFQQVASALRAEITSGKLPVGSRIPSARDLSATHGVALTTAVRAVDELRREGLVETKRGRGSFVCRVPELVRRGGPVQRRRPSQRWKSAVDGATDRVEADRWTEPASAVTAERLKIAEGDEVSVARYLWLVDDLPIQVSYQWEPLAITRGTPVEVPVDATPGNPGVIERMDSIGWHVDRVNQEIRTRMPTSDESKLLRLTAGIPVFEIRRFHCVGDTPVETALITIRGDRMVIAETYPVAMLEDES